MSFQLLVVVILLGFILTKPLNFGMSIATASKKEAVAQGSFSHASWNDLLKKHVKKRPGTTAVDYASIKKSPQPFEKYLKALSSVSQKQYDRWKDPEKLAFLINAYNAFTVKWIVDHYPTQGIKKTVGFLSSPWKQEFFQLLGKKSWLDKIEHEMIRVFFKEPRIHFAVNCASIGCPALLSEAFTAKKLDQQLETAARNFLSDKSRNCFDAKRKKLKLSKIFDWYGRDFVKMKGISVKEFVAPRISKDPATQRMILSDQVSTEYLDYDWNLNDSKRPAPAVKSACS